MNRIRTESDTIPSRIVRLIACGAGLALAASPALAQDYEWEEGEGWHQEEWYDPSDWYDDEMYDGIYSLDYEYHTSAYDAYWDGYYDGYYDDVYGYDHWNDDWSANYESAYTDGYYDGYYDNVSDYDYDPYYYVYTWSVGTPDASRSSDDKRSQGDRASKDSKSSDADKKQAAKKASKQIRIRGTLDSASEASIDNIEGHVLMTLEFENGDTHTVCFGPKMTRDNLPLQPGERITIKGDRDTRDGEKMLVASSVVHDGRTYTLREDKPKRGSASSGG